MQEKERLRLASNSSLNVLTNPNAPLKRCQLLKFLHISYLLKKNLSKLLFIYFDSSDIIMTYISVYLIKLFSSKSPLVGAQLLNLKE